MKELVSLYRQIRTEKSSPLSDFLLKIAFMSVLAALHFLTWIDGKKKKSPADTLQDDESEGD